MATFPRNIHIMNYDTLIRAETLQTNLADCVVIDVRHQLSDLAWGHQAYCRGHIPGGHFLDMENDLSGVKNGHNGRHPLPDVNVFAAKLNSLGVQPDVQVVVYDQNSGAMAARLWWMIKHWLGHKKVAVLDGGWEGWLAAGGASSTELANTAQIGAAVNTAAAQCQPESVVPVQEILANLEQPTFVVVDARTSERFEGRNEPIDPVAGHIPGAINRPQGMNLGPDGCFKSAAVLAEEWAQLLHGRKPHDVVHQCGSGVTACHNLLAMDVAGLKGSRVYAGSWSEWCADPIRPVATGP